MMERGPRGAHSQESRNVPVSPPENPLHCAIYLTGPTASGKTAVAVALADRLDAEILALDSMTLYRGMDIGTAKPSMQERAGISHHLIDVLDPWQSASVAEYRAWAIEAVGQIEARGKRPLFVGGTALYLKALLRGLFPGPGADESLRNALEDEANCLGDRALHERLARLDPAAAARLHPNDRRRVIRALEVLTATGVPLSQWQTEHARAAPANVLVYALWPPRQTLRSRIDRRVVAMFDQGLVKEVRRLIDAPRPLGPVPAQGVGYKEVIEMLQGAGGLDETITKVQARTRQFAKRQNTWLRGLAEVRMLEVVGDEGHQEVADRLAFQIDRQTDLSRIPPL
jgi:tRNA dimethylallyltransferase